MYIRECEGWSLGPYLRRYFGKKEAAIMPQSLGVHFKMEIFLNFDHNFHIAQASLKRGS